MQTKIGTLPKEDIVINKAIVDSDLDGIICASLLKSIFGDLKITLTEPKLIQQGIFDKIIDNKTVIADLGYVRGCGLYFDHHIYNKPKEEIVGIWANAPSAAGIIYESYKTKFDLNKYKEMIEFIDRFDSGDISIKQIENPDFLLNLAFATTRRDKAFGNLLVEYFWKMESIEELKSIEKINEKVEKFQLKKDKYFEYLKSNIEIIDNIAFVDTRNFDSDIVHAFLVNAIYPKTDVVVMIKNDNADPGRINLSISRNNLNENVKEHNLLAVANKLNPKISGGHKYACGASLPKELSLDEAKKSILRMLKIY
jgi:oligoribonuclease NrnB/cAMP/cGMP phosphodiesterase (DHH superfamily)